MLTLGISIRLDGSTSGGGTVILPPTASGVTFTGTLSIGSTLTQSHSYSDPQGLPESGTTYRWQRADDGSGTNAADISGATSATYNVQTADMNKYIRVGVTPRNSAAVVGAEVFSAWQQAWITNLDYAATVFQMNMGASTADSSASAHTITMSGTNPPYLSAAQQLFGANTLRFDSGSSSFMRVTGLLSDFAYGTGDFTIEFWIRPDSGGNSDIWIQKNNSNYTNALFIGRAGSAALLYGNTAVYITGAALTGAAWNHCAICRASGQTKLFIGGVQSGITYADTINFVEANAAATGFGGPTGCSVGYYGPVRVMNGRAKYTANFTPPAAPFPTTQYIAP